MGEQIQPIKIIINRIADITLEKNLFFLYLFLSNGLLMWQTGASKQIHKKLKIDINMTNIGKALSLLNLIPKNIDKEKMLIKVIIHNLLLLA